MFSISRTLKVLVSFCLCHFTFASLVNPRDLLLSFRKEMIQTLTESHLQAAADHDISMSQYINSDSAVGNEVMIACTSYTNGPTLNSLLSSKLASHDFHAVYFSSKNNRACYSISVDSKSPIVTDLNGHGISVSAVPSAIKLDESVERLANAIAEGKRNHFVLEISVGIGMGNKGLSKRDGSHSSLGKSLIQQATNVLSDNTLLSKHWETFFWTSHSAKTSILFNERKYSRFLSSTDSLECSFNDLEIDSSPSHVLLISNDAVSSQCMLYLATIASLRRDVNLVSAYSTEFSSNTKAEAVPYDDATAIPTDQNAWVQSGNSIDTPYTDMGVDGYNYVCGYIDSGADDLSCFLIDDSGEKTTRTPGNQYANPITEEYRRKVIQYVAWGDGDPSYDYDHGTWCGGSVVGKCIDAASSANDYNGVAPNAKMTMFDIDIAASDNFLNVPSLYDIALPPAYAAGARVHSDSWGTPGINAYTSKSIDVDQFMYDNTDFLFVVAAANDGDYGYHSVGSPGVSKNALTVGATSVDHDYLVYFSSIGANYDGAIKPNIVAPGRYLYSTGVHNGGADWNASCNVQISSGTSMATPMTAGAAILIRHYMENETYWGSVCNKNYDSCPKVNANLDSTFISGALLKALVIHSGEGLKGAESSSGSVLPAQNLTTPPDVFQGWGQVLLKNVLPVTGLYDFDLFVKDYVAISSLQRTTYTVTVSNVNTPLRATIVWTDVVNVVWAAKTLLNDLDLTVTTPSGEVLYGNSIVGDEFNPVERVIIDTPVVGVYKVVVTSKILVTDSQDYSVVISSNGEVTAINTVAITTADIKYETDRTDCESVAGNHFLRFQLEDWEEGESWKDLLFTISDSTKKVVDSCTFIPNADLSTAEFNRIYQCTFCLPSNDNVDESYTVAVDTASVPNGGYVRVASQQCNIWLSSYQQSASMNLDTHGHCNYCSGSNGLLEVLMFANVTDDDYHDYSWYGGAVWKLTNADKSVSIAGTLMVSDEQAERYCLPPGTYSISLNDDALFAEIGLHATAVFSGNGIASSVTLHGGNVVTGSVTLASQGFTDDYLNVDDPATDDGAADDVADDPAGDDTDSSSDSSSDKDVTKSAGFIAGITIACIVIAAVIGVAVWKFSQKSGEQGQSMSLL